MAYRDGQDVDLRALEQRRAGAISYDSGAAEAELTIEDVAELARMTARNVRAYQQRKLLPPVRRQGRRLVYTWEHVARLRLIRSLHARGLSLKVIEDLVARGAAEDELARLNQESGPGTDRLRVPIGDISTQLIKAGDPGLVAELVDAGVVHLDNGQLVASSASLGVAGALLGHGVDLQAICRVVLLASKAANGVANRLQSEIAAVEGVEPHTVALAMRLASISFSDTLLDVAESMPTLPAPAVLDATDPEHAVAGR